MKLPGWLHNLLHNRTEAESIAQRPDRRILTETLLPAFANFSAILWIGCQAYTRAYYDILESRGGQVTTLDLDPASAPWGRDGRHVTGSLIEADRLFAAGAFDAIICNGVFGWGVDTPADRAAALGAMAAGLRPGGVLLMGWNHHKTPDPVELAARWFDRHALPGVPGHIAVAKSTHRYDLLVRRA